MRSMELTTTTQAKLRLRVEWSEGYLVDSMELRTQDTLRFDFNIDVVHWALIYH